MAKREFKLESRSTKAKSNKPAQNFPYTRKLKVRSSYYYQQYHAAWHRERRFPESVPWINIKGYWLKEAGFVIDTPLNVEINEGRIVLTFDSV